MTSPGPSRARRLLVRGLVGTVALAVVGAAAAAAYGVGGRPAGSGRAEPAPATTTTVTRRTLVDASTVTGRVAFRDPVPVTSAASGTVTWLPAPGTVVSRNQPLLRVDDRPVVLLYGTLPMYRPLTTGTKGNDVKQFVANLRQLGYLRSAGNGEYTAGTAAAVKRWQKDLDRDPTGTVDVADVIYAAGPLRVAKQSVRVGAKVAGEVLTATGTDRVVAADVPVRDQRVATAGLTVTLQLEGGKSLPATVTAVGPTAEKLLVAESGPKDGDSGGAQDTTLVLISVSGAVPLTAPADTPVTVRYVATTRADVLTVPVQALLAVAGGGYGLEVRDPAGGRRLTVVRTGLFADGQVEVSGDGLAEGMTVGMAG
jgi:hypothetical protein